MPTCRCSLHLGPSGSYNVRPECSNTIIPPFAGVLRCSWSSERTEGPVSQSEPPNEVYEAPQKLYAMQHSVKDLQYHQNTERCRKNAWRQKLKLEIPKVRAHGGSLEDAGTHAACLIPRAARMKSLQLDN